MARVDSSAASGGSAGLRASSAACASWPSAFHSPAAPASTSSLVVAASRAASTAVRSSSATRFQSPAHAPRPPASSRQQARRLLATRTAAEAGDRGAPARRLWPAAAAPRRPRRAMASWRLQSPAAHLHTTPRRSGSRSIGRGTPQRLRQLVVGEAPARGAPPAHRGTGRSRVQPQAVIVGVERGDETGHGARCSIEPLRGGARRSVGGGNG